jgi:glycosyltransferase involved in cell wall biosynthesis
LSKIEKPVSLSIYGYEPQEKVEMKIPASVQLNLRKPLDEIELRKEICKHDFFIIPSKTDSFPLALLEAMETGILFISTNRVGLTERLPKPFKRFVIPYGNTENLKNKILELHNLDNAVKNNIAGEIREFTKEFTWEKISDQYIKLYTELLDR